MTDNRKGAATLNFLNYTHGLKQIGREDTEIRGVVRWRGSGVVGLDFY